MLQFYPPSIRGKRKDTQNQPRRNPKPTEIQRKGEELEEGWGSLWEPGRRRRGGVVPVLSCKGKGFTLRRTSPQPLSVRLLEDADLTQERGPREVDSVQK